MQDKQTGHMIPLDMLPLGGEALLAKLVEQQPALQAIKDQALPDRSRQGGILAVGQEVTIAGCRFKISAIRKTKVILKGIPT